MEVIFSDIINNTKVPRFVKYIIITLTIVFLEFVFIGVAINGVTKYAMPFGIIMAILLFIVYIYFIVKIKKDNFIRKEKEE